MSQQWRVRITGEQREASDIDVLVQAVIALGRQISKEAQAGADISELPDQPEDGRQGAET